MRLHYGGIPFEIAVTRERLGELLDAATADRRGWQGVESPDGARGIFLLGGGIPVAFPAKPGEELPDVGAEDGGDSDSPGIY